MEESIHNCLICKKNYNHNDNIPIILRCGDTLCSNCISNFQQINKSDYFECPECVKETSSLNIENKLAFEKIIIDKKSENIQIYKEFEVIIKRHDRRFKVKVKKEMTIKELKEKINKQEGYNFNEIILVFKRPLMDDKTLEFYGIVKPCTLISVIPVVGG